MHVISPPDPAQETLFVNGNIYTVDPVFSCVSVLAVKQGRIVYAGSVVDDAARLLAPQAKTVDLDGKTVIPGLIDSHLHFTLQGQRLSEIDIYLKQKEDILRLVALEAQRLEPGEWIVGRGWNHEIWAVNQWPCKEELDAVAPNNPVALNRADAHSMWVNSLALRAAGIERGCSVPQGGEILRRPDGELQGILIDTPIFWIWAAIPSLNETQARHAYLKAQAELFGYGITSVGDAWQTMNDHERIYQAYASGDLKIRMYGMLGSADMAGRYSFQEEYQPVWDLFNKRLSLRAFKVVLDGSLGSRSAWLNEEYADRAGHMGNSRYTDEQLLALIAPASRQGFQICIHAIGDAAVHQALNALEKMQGGHSCAARHRIEHFQTVSPEDIVRCVKLGVVPAMQTMHALSDRQMAENRLGAASLSRAYPWRALLDAGGIFANGSDAPMEIISPFMGIYAGLSRVDSIDDMTGSLRRLSLTREEILRSYTNWAAYAEFGEKSKGSLEPGKLADFIVLDRDIMRCPVEDIQDTRILLTFVNGELVHGDL